MTCRRLVAAMVLAALLWDVVLSVSWVRDCEEEECSRFVCGPATRCVRGYGPYDSPQPCACFLRVSCGGCTGTCGVNASCVCTGTLCLPGSIDCPDVGCVVDTTSTTALPASTTSPAST